MSQTADDVDRDEDWTWSPSIVDEEGDPIEVESDPAVFEYRREGDILAFLLEEGDACARAMSGSLRCQTGDKLFESIRNLREQGLLEADTDPSDGRRLIYSIPEESRAEAEALLAEAKRP